MNINLSKQLYPMMNGIYNFKNNINFFILSLIINIYIYITPIIINRLISLVEIVILSASNKK